MFRGTVSPKDLVNHDMWPGDWAIVGDYRWTMTSLGTFTFGGFAFGA